MTSTIIFRNDTDLSVNLNYWVSESSGYSKLQITLVNPRETVLLSSSVGEWHIESMMADRTMWKERGYDKCLYIGKFWNKPCIHGTYSIIDYPDFFECLYFVNEETPEGTICFREKYKE
jgi:hypothetical protein